MLLRPVGQVAGCCFKMPEELSSDAEVDLRSLSENMSKYYVDVSRTKC